MTGEHRTATQEIGAVWSVKPRVTVVEDERATYMAKRAAELLHGLWLRRQETRAAPA